MTQVEFMWKMKSLGLNVLQTTNTIVQVTLTSGVTLEHSTHLKHTLMTLVLGELGTEDEIDIPVERTKGGLDEIIEMYKANASFDDYKSKYANA